MPQNRTTCRPLVTATFLPSLGLMLLLSGCATDPTLKESALLAQVPSTELNRASALEAQGEAAAASEIYLELASQARPPARAQLQLKAARNYLSTGQTAPARKAIDAVSARELTATQQELLLLAKADLALLTGRPKDAIGFLERMQPRTLPRDLRAQRLGTLASAQRLATSPVAAAETLLELDRLLERQDERLVNQVSLISTLSLLSPSELQNLARGGGGMSGWAEVALLTQRFGADPNQLETAYRGWRQRHLGHRALPGLARAYTATLSGGYASGDALMVMLPRGGRFATAAKVVRSGIEAASRADQAGQRPRLSFADSSGASRTRTLHARAAREGTDYVIGPLLKSAVDDLVAGGVLRIPTLALNEATRADKRAENLYQFSLSPENEATEVANQAAAMGLNRALLLYPEGEWGDRLASAFRRQWRNSNGVLVGQARFNPTGGGHTQTLERLLASGDADMLFLVATADLARRLYPQIRLASAKPLMVISTSHVYAGRFEPERDRALIGLYFVDIPWMLEDGGSGPLSRRDWVGRSPEALAPLARLYAMGIDAYRLAPRLSELAKNPGTFYPGQTGGLSIDPVGRVQRKLRLGRFTETGPRLADDTGDTGRSASNR